MKNKKLSMKTRVALIGGAILVGIGWNGYKQYQTTGELDQLWFITGGITLVVATAIAISMLRKERKYDEEHS